MSATASAPAHRRASVAELSRAAGRVGAALAGSTLTVAVATAIAFAGDARALLNVRVRRLPATADEAFAIFTHNLTIATLVVALAAVATSARGSHSAPSRISCEFADLVVLGIAAANVVHVGLAMGGYGGEMALALVPHAPFELAGFALAGGVYLQARRTGVGLRHLATAGGLIAAALAIAAVLETAVQVVP
jgi:Stage II sporulation protein M